MKERKSSKSPINYMFHHLISSNSSASLLSNILFIMRAPPLATLNEKRIEMFMANGQLASNVDVETIPCNLALNLIILSALTRHRINFAGGFNSTSAIGSSSSTSSQARACVRGNVIGKKLQWMLHVMCLSLNEFCTCLPLFQAQAQAHHRRPFVSQVEKKGNQTRSNPFFDIAHCLSRRDAVLSHRCRPKRTTGGEERGDKKKLMKIKININVNMNGKLAKNRFECCDKRRPRTTSYSKRFARCARMNSFLQTKIRTRRMTCTLVRCLSRTMYGQWQR